MNDKEAKRFYNSKQWKIKRICILERDNYECCDCRERLKEAAVKGVYLNPEQRKIHMAADVHHIKSLKEHPELRLDDDNLVSLCSECHNARHGRTTKRFNQKKKRVTQERW